MRRRGLDQLTGLTIVCGCRDWRIEPDPEVKAAMEEELRSVAGTPGSGGGADAAL